MAVPLYPAGTTINHRYTLGKKLGSDGSVYEAHDIHLNKTVAIKILDPANLLGQPWDEAQRLEALRSEFLVDVINADVDVSSDLRYIVTPLLPGGDLEALARPCGLSTHKVVRYARQIAAGIDRIHAAGMVHRDIKPANALLRGDTIAVSDLEYCEILDASGRAERNGSWCTLAPETAPDDGYCSARSDVYSLGATVFYLLSGQYPVDVQLPLREQQARISRGEIRELRTLAPHVSQPIGTVIRKALHLNPDARHDSAEAFGNALVTAARNSRNWTPLVHPGHMLCMHGDEYRARTAVEICCSKAGSKISIQARLASGRKVPGLADQAATSATLAKAVQRIVKQLS